SMKACGYARCEPGPRAVVAVVSRLGTPYCTMKAFVTLLLCSSILAAKAEDEIQIVRHGTNVTERPSAALVTNVVELVRSCLFPNYFPVKAATWQEFEHSDSFILVTFAAPGRPKIKIRDYHWAESKEEIVDQ